MNFLQKVTLCAILLCAGLQLSAKNKDRIFVINNYGADISVRTFHGISAISAQPIVKKGTAACIVASKMNSIQVFDSSNPNAIQLYSAAARGKVKTGDIIVVTKDKKIPSLKIYKNYDAFIDANPDFILGSNVICPNVLPELMS